MTTTLKSSKVITILILGFNSSFASVVQSSLTWGPTEALVNHATTQFQYQNRLLDEAKHDLEETKRDLEVFKRAFLNAERDKHDLKERFEQEKQALNDEIRRLREPGMHGRAEMFEQVLKDGILQLKVRPSLSLRQMRGHRRVFRVSSFPSTSGFLV